MLFCRIDKNCLLRDSSVRKWRRVALTSRIFFIGPRDAVRKQTMWWLDKREDSFLYIHPPPADLSNCPAPKELDLSKLKGKTYLKEGVRNNEGFYLWDKYICSSADRSSSRNVHTRNSSIPECWGPKATPSRAWRCPLQKATAQLYQQRLYRVASQNSTQEAALTKPSPRVSHLIPKSKSRHRFKFPS